MSVGLHVIASNGLFCHRLLAQPHKGVPTNRPQDSGKARLRDTTSCKIHPVPMIFSGQPTKLCMP